MKGARAKNHVLVCTPSFAGGSWIFLKNILEEMLSSFDDLEILAVGLSKPFHKSRFKYFTIPYPRYDRWGYFTVDRTLLTFLWYLPIYVMGNVLALIHRPRIVIGNGFTSIAALGLAKYLGAYTVVTHQVKGSFENMNGFSRRLFRHVLGSVDLVVANSQGCAEDLNGLMPAERIVKVELWADEIFFRDPVEKASSVCLTILYVGLLNRAKFCFAARDLAEKFKNREGIKFIFVGVGEYAAEIARLASSSTNIEYLGYITDREQLARLYRQSDIVWSYADESYLGLPAIEALASGTPIMIPKYATLTFEERRDPVDVDLVPRSIGWFVDPYDSAGSCHLITEIIVKGINETMRQQCREHALRRYNRENARALLDRFTTILESASRQS